MAPADPTEDFDWLSLHQELQGDAPRESSLEKLVRKSKENPLVPIGAAATTWALCYGVWNFRMGRQKMSQYMMRTRVGAQAFTVLAIVLSYVYGVSGK